MNIHTAIRWVEESNRLIDGASFISSSRTRASIGLLHLSIEHNKGLVTSVEHGIFGSAFALFRCQFETFIRGVWLQWCANDKEIHKFLNGEEPPKINILLKAIKAVPGFEKDTLSVVKKKLWKAMNDYTHGGALQVKARNTEKEIIINYQVRHIEALLEYSVHLAYSCGVQVANVCDNGDLANKLMSLHLELNAI